MDYKKKLIDGVASRGVQLDMDKILRAYDIARDVHGDQMRQSGEPYHLQDGCFMAKKELKFYKERNMEIRDLVKRADFTTLQQLQEDGVSAVTVVLYTSARSGFCAAQVFEYEEMEMRPTSDLVVKL